MNRSSLALLLLLAACHSGVSTAPDAAPPLAGAAIGGPFALTDQEGRAVTDRSYAGRYRIMYFGYTFCPDVCPTDVATIAGAVKLLEASDPGLATNIVPIFVTVDPQRDTSSVLKQFVSAFHPRLQGLTGTPQAIAAVTKQFGIFAGRGEVQKGGGYLVNHSRQAYLMNRDGKPLALPPVEQGPRAVADEIKRWAR